MGETCSTYREEEKYKYRALVGKLAKKRPPARLRCKWEDNININVK